MTSMPTDRLQVSFTNIDPQALRVLEWEQDAKVHGKVQRVDFGFPYRDLWVLPDVHFRFVFRAVDKYRPEIRNSLLITLNPVKVATGCNHGMIPDWQAALDQINGILHQEPGMESLDIRNGVIYWLEVAANLQVRDNDQEYVAALWKARYPRREIHPHIDEKGNKSGLEFKTKSGHRALVIYLKFLECGHAVARGTLHFEDRLLRKKQITETFGVHDLTLGALRADWMWDLLEADMKVLGLDRAIMSNRIELEHALRQTYTDRQSRGVLGFAVQKESRGGYEGLRRTSTSRQSIERFEDLLAAANITNYSLDGRKALPPLLPILQARRNADEASDNPDRSHAHSANTQAIDQPMDASLSRGESE